MSLDDTDPLFPEDLAASNEHVWKVARWFQSVGIAAAVQPIRLRPTPEERGEYGDNGDLLIVQRVEVKQRRFDWSGRGDFPYPTIIVDVCHSWDRAFPKPYAYVITNESVTQAIIVLGSTAGAWKRESRFDGRIGRMRDFYECPLEHAQFRSLVRPPPSSS